MKMTSSCGIGPNKMLAKICSEIDKPNGQTYLPFDQEKIRAFMDERSLKDIPGIGGVTEQTLNGLGITQSKDIRNYLVEIYINFSEGFFEFLSKASLGISRNRHEQDNTALKKSLSFSRSFRPITRLEQFSTRLTALAKQMADKVEEDKLMARTIVIEF